jgi:hypothetical protein
VEHETPRLGSNGRCPRGLPISQGYPHHHHAHHTARPGPLDPDRAHAATTTPHPSASPASNGPPPRHLLQKPPGPPDAAPPCSDTLQEAPPLPSTILGDGRRHRCWLRRQQRPGQDGVGKDVVRVPGSPKSPELERPGRQFRLGGSHPRIFHS